MTQPFFDAMLDTETLGGPPNGALMQIGCVFFDLRTRTMGPQFQKTIHVATSVRDGGKIDPETVLWWLGQSEEARKVRFGGEDIKEVLREFKLWLAGVCRLEDLRLWGNSASFDLSIVGSAYDRMAVPRPWHWSKERCYRTFRNMYPQVPYDPERKGTGAHDALTDAKFQVAHMFEIVEWKHANTSTPMEVR